MSEKLNQKQLDLKKLELKRRKGKLDRMLLDWGRVLVHRDAGGVGYPAPEAESARGTGVSGLCAIGQNYLAVEEQLMHLHSKKARGDSKVEGFRERIRRRLEAEYRARAMGSNWTLMGWIEDCCQIERGQRPWGRKTEKEFRGWFRIMARVLVDGEDVGV